MMVLMALTELKVKKVKPDLKVPWDLKEKWGLVENLVPLVRMDTWEIKENLELKVILRIYHNVIGSSTKTKKLFVYKHFVHLCKSVKGLVFTPFTCNLCAQVKKET